MGRTKLNIHTDRGIRQAIRSRGIRAYQIPRNPIAARPRPGDSDAGTVVAADDVARGGNLAADAVELTVGRLRADCPSAAGIRELKQRGYAVGHIEGETSLEGSQISKNSWPGT
jgi:hypothetical protein